MSVPQSDEKSPLYAEIVRRHEREQILRKAASIEFETKCDVLKERKCVVCGNYLIKTNQTVCSAKCRRVLELSFIYR